MGLLVGFIEGPPGSVIDDQRNIRLVAGAQKPRGDRERIRVNLEGEVFPRKGRWFFGVGRFRPEVIVDPERVGGETPGRVAAGRGARMER
jgi:hypothetical protein